MKSLHTHPQSKLLAPQRDVMNGLELTDHNGSTTTKSRDRSGFMRRLARLLLLVLICLALTWTSAPARLSREVPSPKLAVPAAISCTGTIEDAKVQLAWDRGYFASTASTSADCTSALNQIEQLGGLQDLSYQKTTLQGDPDFFGCFWPSSTVNNLTVPDLPFPPQELVTPTADKFTMTITKTGNATGDFNQTSGVMNLNMPVAIQFVSQDPDLNLGSACKFTTTLRLTTEGTGGKRYQAVTAKVTLVDSRVVPVAASNINCGDKTALVNAMLAAVNSNCLTLNTSLSFNLLLGFTRLTETEPNDDPVKNPNSVAPGIATISGGISYGNDDEFYTTYTLEPGRTITFTHKVIETQTKSLGATCEIKGTTVNYSGPFTAITCKDYKTQKALSFSSSSTKTKLPVEPFEPDDSGCTMTRTKYEYVEVTSFKNLGSQAIQLAPRFRFMPSPQSGRNLSNNYLIAISFQ